MVSTIRAWRVPPALVEEASVGHLVRERVLERVFEVGEEARLVEELGRLEMGEPSAQLLLTLVRDRHQQGEGHILADDRGRLEQAFVFWRESVDPGGEDGLDRGRNLDLGEGLRQPVRAARAHERLGFHQRP